MDAVTKRGLKIWTAIFFGVFVLFDLVGFLVGMFFAVLKLGLDYVGKVRRLTETKTLTGG
jgi:hypothetical protein